ncbi:ATP-binding protein [Pseudobacteroides cellulosolvens]|uniref:AAA ATPase central domain protein n=1 Tax=Pseudobacteroides cellulosolvens ATCC 35603 = DSM 2933 TaxID=398512 RepID=A0A0L6JHK7_9FIRM|nr:ATP-binding protein [Pseudobacteroides cellulosolvens]KNY25341.1 AAA ATPase central domain protein [Pseudobacteroides cellulosolvens ATCC 35603 = DSM 2933]
MLDSIYLKSEFINQEIDGYILDLLVILDIKILRLLIKIQNACVESSNQGFSMNFVEIFKLFTNEGEIHNTEELQQLKGAYISREMSIEHKRQKNNLDLLCEKFSLSWFERQVMIMSLAAELHPKYEKAYGLIADDISVKYPTMEIVLKILFDDQLDFIKHKRQWINGGSLQKFLLSDSPWNQYGQNREMRLDSKIVYFILGMDKLPYELENHIEIFHPDEILPPILTKMDLQESLRSYYNAALQDNETILINLEGAYGTGKTFQLKHLCYGIGRKLLLVDMKLFLSDASPEKIIKSILCEKILQDAVLAIKMPETIEDKLISILHQLKTEFIKEYPFGEALYIISTDSLKKYHTGQKDKILHYKLDLPCEQERKIIWQTIGKQYKFSTQINWGEFASKFRFTPGQIKDTFELANMNSAGKRSKPEGIDQSSLISACYQNGKSHLITKARKIETKFQWEDIILPDDAKSLLKDACNQMKFRQTVFGDWGFEKKLSYGKGLSILFSGPPGTGKTMSAQVVANELQLELYKVDIANLVSKYIGETEKNLEGIFDEAQLSNAILFFDEADAIFGKRTEVKDSHDRHANVETSYLLQRIEEYEGVTILATNYVKNIDEAFLRRINFVIEFPFPDAAYREKIWRSIFPKETPLQEGIEFSLISKKFEVSGGNIKNIAISAAFIAAEKNEPVGTCHIIKAARNELNKIGKMINLDDLEEYL